MTGKRISVARVVTLGSSKGLYGGPFDTAVRQAKVIASGGHKVSMVAGYFAGDKPQLDRALEDSTFLVKRLPFTRGFIMVFSVSAFVRIWGAIRKSTVVHVSFARELLPIWASVSALIMRKPLVIQPHGMLTSRTSVLHRVVDLPIRAIFKRASVVIALTQHEEAELRRWCKSKVIYECIGNPVVLPPESTLLSAKEARSRRQSKRVLWAARLHPRKDVKTFIEAAEVAEGRDWEEEYHILGPDQGDGALVVSAAARIQRLTYGGGVSANEVTSQLCNSDVFVLTSRDEPWGNVLALAILLGTPIVVAQSAALASTVGSRANGFVVPDGDAEALADAIHAAARSSWLPTAARGVPPVLDVDSTCTQLEASYLVALKGCARGRMERSP